jgi:hypothetical protein
MDGGFDAASGAARDLPAGLHVLRHHRPGGDDSAGPDYTLGDHHGASADQDPLSNDDPAGQHRAGRDMRARADLDVMFDDGGGIDDRASANDGARTDDGARTNKHACVQARLPGNNRSVVNNHRRFRAK